MSVARAQSAVKSVGWRAIAAGPAVAAVTVVIALVATGDVDVPLRDPDNVAATYFVLVGLGVALLVWLDVAIRATKAEGAGFPPSRAAMSAVRRERWTASRSLVAASALLGFYVTYMAYRNLKGVVPLIRPDALFDRQLADWDRALFGGHDPATVLHTLLGTGVATQILSTAYVAFILFLPLTIGASLVFSRDLRAPLYYTTAQSINWLIGAGSYFLFPALGPAYAEPSRFAGLPHSEVTHLQAVLLDQRIAFLHDPAGATPQAIAAFASLHISMSFTAAVAGHLLGLGRRLKIALWVWFGVTMTGTIYLGWHYLVDNIAGIVLGTIALILAGLITGIDPRTVGRQRRAKLVTPGRRWSGPGRSDERRGVVGDTL
jgi:membrane-associated phospholipid phosphatase